MEPTELIERTELHDSSLIEMAVEGDQVRLRFENVWVDDKDCYIVTIDLGGVRKILCDGRAVRTVRMKTEDGCVIAFSRAGHIAHLVVAWTSYAPRTDETHSYEFDFTSFDLRGEKQE